MISPEVMEWVNAAERDRGAATVLIESDRQPYEIIAFHCQQCVEKCFKAVLEEEAVDDDLTFDEIYYSVTQGEIIEDYPTDRPFPSCLIMGRNFSGQAIHSVWAHNPKNQWAVLITVYRPDPAKWMDGKIRRKK